MLGLLRETSSTEALVETIHATTGIDNLLLAGIERVALATHI
jgi:hypothetical protein